MDVMLSYAMTCARFLIIGLSLWILGRCLHSMLSGRYGSEIWARLENDERSYTLTHWENLIGSGFSSDIRIGGHGLRSCHCVLCRDDRGRWRAFDVFGRAGVWVNGEKAGAKGLPVKDGDLLSMGTAMIRFRDIAPSQRRLNEAARISAGANVSPTFTLALLSLLQLCLLFQLSVSQSQDIASISLAFLALIALQWLCYSANRLMGRRGFEPETLAFYLSSLGLTVAAASTPEDMFKQTMLIVVAVGLFILSGWWLRSLDRTRFFRIPVAALSLALLALNVALSDAVLGARNWLEIGGFSMQPSELVKVGYVYVGASTMDKLFQKKDLYGFIAFSAACVIALALIGDFGTALVFFVCFLMISFLRSGSIATVLLAVSGAAFAAVLVITVKPHVAQRFATWGHAWEDIYGAGFQQTRAMSAAASGGLTGKGAGQGWLKDIFAANTDMVFALICEELGLIVGLCMVAAVVIMCLFMLRSARRGRSAYYPMAACAALAIMLTQMSLNVFGTLDLLPFTGVTFPFVSKGGTSFISCWLLLSFIKSADNRRGGSFAVKGPGRLRRKDLLEAELWEEDEDELEDDMQDDEQDWERDTDRRYRSGRSSAYETWDDLEAIEPIDPRRQGGRR